jgi:hypothetical protein
MRDRFITFVLRFGKRRTKRQKNRFIAMLIDYMEPLGYELKVHQFKHAGRNGRNIIVGNLAEAKKIYLADYDTKERILNEDYRYYPFDDQFNIQSLRMNLMKYFIAAVIFFVLMVIAILLAPSQDGTMKYVYYGIAIAFALISYFSMKGLPSPYNFKKTATLFLLCELAKTEHECCFVFLDYSSFTGAGKYYFFQEYDLDGKLVVYLDNAGQGSKTVALISDNAERDYIKQLQKLQELTEVQVSHNDSATEKNFLYLYLTLCEKDEEQRCYIDQIGTRTDSEFSEEAYLAFVNVLEKLVSIKKQS